MNMPETCYKGVYADITDRIIRAAIEVHKELGCGLKEEAYEATLAWELERDGHDVKRQIPCPVIYKGIVFCSDDEHPKRIDLLVDDKVVVEVKAVSTKHPVFAAQCRTYLRMMNLPVGLVLNFGFPTLKEGLEHVFNPRAPIQNLPNSKSPSSESKGEMNQDGDVAVAAGRLGDWEIGSNSPKVSETPSLQISK